MSDAKNERGRTPQQELEILRMSILRIAQALDTRDKLPGTDTNLGNRDSYGLDEEVQACQQNTGWNRLAASCVSMAEAMKVDSDESWKRAKHYYALMMAYVDGAKALAAIRDELSRSLDGIHRLEAAVQDTEARTLALFDSPEGRAIKKLLEE